MSNTQQTTVDSVAEEETRDAAEEIEAETPQPISKDTQFGMLKNRRRRDILRYLRENDDESTLSDLAEFIAAKENDVDRQLLSSDERKRVYIGLYQCHLPKMDDARIIDFDKRSGGVTLRPEADQLFTYIDHDSNTDTDADDDASDDTDTTEPRVWGVDRRIKLGLGWSLCLLAALSAVGIAGLPSVGLIGLVAIVSFATVETVDALPSLLRRDVSAVTTE